MEPPRVQPARRASDLQDRSQRVMSDARDAALELAADIIAYQDAELVKYRREQAGLILDFRRMA